MNEHLTIQDIAKLAPLIALALALLKLLLLPFCLWVFGKMLELCKAKLKEIIDELYKEQLQANAVSREAVKGMRDEVESMEKILSGITETMRQLNQIPNMVKSFEHVVTGLDATMKEVQHGVQEMREEVSFWRGALTNSGVLKK